MPNQILSDATNSPNEIKDEVLNEDPKFKDKFEKLWKNIPELSSADFEQYYDDSKKTINQKYSYRISKFLALEIIDALNKSNNPNEIIGVIQFNNDDVKRWILHTIISSESFVESFQIQRFPGIEREIVD
mgnify:CR=1 FL=1